MSTSADGGLTWSAPAGTADGGAGVGGQPVVQPSGKVIVPIADAFETGIQAFSSSDGGASWSGMATIATVNEHAAQGNLRAGPLPSAAIDGSGRVYVAWQDCGFRPSCSANDIVMATSDDGTNWQTSRVPIDDVSSGVDHFIPGLGVDRSSAGAGARLALTYYYYPDASCAPSACQLDVGYVSSADGGSTWSAPIRLAGPMQLGWLASTTQGAMVGDYISTSFVSGSPRTVVAVAGPPAGSGALDEGMYASSALPVPPATLGSPVSAASPAGPSLAATTLAAPQAPLVSTAGSPGPVIQELTVSPARFRAASAGASVARATGATISYAQSQGGSTDFTAARLATGRRQGGKCRAVNRRNSTRRACARVVHLPGGFAVPAAGGVNHLHFTGRLAGSTLTPGRYRLIAVPRAASGAAGAPARVDFVILRRRGARRPVAVR
jgi:hypothetical protein